VLHGTDCGLTQLGSDHIKVLLKAFSVLHQMAFTLSIFLRQTHRIKSSPVVRRGLAQAFQAFAHFASDIKEYLTVQCLGIPFDKSVDFNTVVTLGTSSFYEHLEQVSVSMWKAATDCTSYNLHAIRDFLVPQDTVVKTLMSSRLYSETTRAEFTCNWFAPRLRKFVKNTKGGNDVFLVTGDVCTGKTVLSRWIQEKLQESLEDEPYDVITYSVDETLNYTTSSFSLVKSLLLQTMDHRIGQDGLLSKVSEAMHQAQSGCSAAEVERTLWAALEAALDERKLLILVDGLDQLRTKNDGDIEILGELSKIARSRRNVKAIVLSRPLGDAARQHCQEYLSLEECTEAANDIRHFVEDLIQHKLHKLKDSEKSDIINEFAKFSGRSFLWAELHLQNIRHEDSASAILKALKDAPKTAEKSLDQLLGKLELKRTDTKRILSWVLAAVRPLTIKELKGLIEVDLDHTSYRPFSGDVENLVRQLCGSLMVIRDGLVHLRHPSMRKQIISATSHKNAPLTIDLEAAHKELATRAVAYVKLHLLHFEDVDPQFDFCSGKEMARSFAQHALLEYASRYWLLHFHASSLYDSNTQKINLSEQFKRSFPNSIRLALYEGSCFGRQFIAAKAETYQSLALAVRQTLFQDNSPTTLQSVLMEIRIANGFKDKYVLSNYSYQAYRMSIHVYPRVRRSLAEAFISYSENLDIAQSSELIQRKIEVLQYIVECYEQERVEGKLIAYLGVLAELYVEAEEFHKAVAIYRKLYRLRLSAYGHLHEETRSMFSLLLSYLDRLSLHDEALELTLEYHQYVEQTLAITDQRRIDSTLTVIQVYEQRKEYFKAEQTLVRYWKSVSSAETSSRITELRVEWAIKYSDFLYRHSRKEECQTVLRGIWSEIQSYSYEYRFQSSMISRVQQIAEYFSKLEVFSMSRSIYQSLYQHYESREERTSTETITIVRTLAETISKSFSYHREESSSESTTVISKEEKNTLIEAFESSLESTEITSTTIAVCQALSSSYFYEERYEEACEIYRQVISKVWSSIESTSASVDINEISEQLTVEVLDLCIKLAECHFKMLHVEVAQTIYFNIFRALICIRHIDDRVFLLEKIKSIIAFFELTYSYERVIEIYRELFIWMPIFFGKTHEETITVLMAFARVCYRLALYEEASTACYFIYSCFCNAHGCLDRGGLEAAFLLAEIYSIQGKWQLAYEVYGYLWRTCLRYGVEYEIDAVTTKKIYERYIFVLEHKQHVEYSVLLQVAKEYYQHCVSRYQAHHEVSISAALAYAHYCEQVEEHYEQSVALYEQVIKHCKTSQTEFSKKTLSICNSRVAKLYASSSKEVSKAVSIYHEEFESRKKTSKTSKETMTALHSYVETCRKTSTKETITKATQTMKTTVQEILQEESSTETLISSAKSMAKIYKESSFTEEAHALVVEMRSKLVEEIRASVTSRSEFSHKSYAFLASFQEAVSESTSFSSVMAEIREEVMLYQSYFEATREQSDYRSIIKSGSSLYLHLQHKEERRSEFVKIKQELTQTFYKYLDLKQKVTESVMDFFFRLYLEEVNHVRYEHAIVAHAEKQVFEYTKASKFAEAYELVVIIDRFVNLHGGFHSEAYVRSGLNLAKYLVGIGTQKCGDQKLYGTMFSLALEILQESLRGLDKVVMELYELQKLLADLIRVLGEQKKYTALEVSCSGVASPFSYTNITLAHPPNFMGVAKSSQQPVIVPIGALYRSIPYPSSCLSQQAVRRHTSVLPHPLQLGVHPWNTRQVYYRVHHSAIRAIHAARTLPGGREATRGHGLPHRRRAIRTWC
jgi:tetratricopeptide (TPR) repeat protein